MFFLSQWALCNIAAGQLTHFRNLLGNNYTINKLKPGSGAMQHSLMQGMKNDFFLKVFVKICSLFKICMLLKKCTKTWGFYVQRNFSYRETQVCMSTSSNLFTLKSKWESCHIDQSFYLQTHVRNSCNMTFNFHIFFSSFKDRSKLKQYQASMEAS